MSHFKNPRILLLVLMLAVMAVSANVQGQQTISYQGRLADPGGTPVSDDTYSLKFIIYGSPTGDDSLWYSGFQLVPVTDGLFSYEMGSVVSIPDDLFTSSPRYLGITVGSDPEMSPRTEMTSSAYSYQALRSDTTDYAKGIADDCVSTHKIQFDAITGAKILTGTITASDIAQNGVGSYQIMDNGILFIDMGTNGASEGQVMKMVGGSWTAAVDETGSGGGDITAVYPGSGMTGGGESGDVTLSVGTGAITTTHLGYNSVTSDKIPDDEITGNDIAHYTLETFHIQDGTIQFTKMAQNGATEGQVMKWLAGNWNAGDVGDITAVYPGDGLTGGGESGDVTLSVGSNAINSDHIQNNSITGNDILTTTIEGHHLQYGTITFDKIGPNGAEDGQVMKASGGMWSAGYVGDITSVTPTELGGLTGGGESGDVELAIANNAVTTEKIYDNTIQNVDINTLAEIEPSKIAGTAATISGDNLFEGTDTFTNLNIITTTRRLALSHAAFVPASSSAVFTRDTDCLKNTTPSAQDFYASVSLPDSAVVTQVEITYYDNEASLNGRLHMYRVSTSEGGIATMAFGNTGGTPGMTTLVDASIVSPTIDNELYNYVIQARLSFSSDANNMRLYGAEIEYTITKPLP